MLPPFLPAAAFFALDDELVVVLRPDTDRFVDGLAAADFLVEVDLVADFAVPVLSRAAEVFLGAAAFVVLAVFLVADVDLRLRVAAAFFADDLRAAFLLDSDLVAPDPPFSPPPVSLFTVAQARLSASPSLRPRFS